MRTTSMTEATQTLPAEVLEYFRQYGAKGGKVVAEKSTREERVAPARKASHSRKRYIAYHSRKSDSDGA